MSCWLLKLLGHIMMVYFLPARREHSIFWGQTKCFWKQKLRDKSQVQDTWLPSPPPSHQLWGAWVWGQRAPLFPHHRTLRKPISFSLSGFVPPSDDGPMIPLKVLQRLNEMLYKTTIHEGQATNTTLFSPPRQENCINPQTGDRSWTKLHFWLPMLPRKKLTTWELNVAQRKKKAFPDPDLGR